MLSTRGAIFNRLLAGGRYLYAIIRRPRILFLRCCFEAHGRGLHFDPDGLYSFENISLGNNVFLGKGATLVAGRSKIRIGDNVMFGPYVSIFGGGHNTVVVGQFMVDVQQKRPEDDLGVQIEDDVWVGARAIILRGVTVGRGAIVGAGAVVTKTVLPYTVVAGSPAKCIQRRFDLETTLRHEDALYPPARRLSRCALSHLNEKTNP